MQPNSRNPDGSLFGAEHGMGDGNPVYPGTRETVSGDGVNDVLRAKQFAYCLKQCRRVNRFGHNFKVKAA